MIEGIYNRSVVEPDPFRDVHRQELIQIRFNYETVFMREKADFILQFKIQKKIV